MSKLFKRNEDADAENREDKYLRLVADLPPFQLGETLEGFLGRNPGVAMPRTADLCVKRETVVYARDPAQILCQGAAVGMDAKNICRHIHPSNEIAGFLGFVIKTLDGDRVAVQTRGAVFLAIPEAKAGDVGKKVYASGPNSFSLSSRGAYEIGKILYIEKPGRAMIAFQKFNSDKKMVLDYQNKTAKFV